MWTVLVVVLVGAKVQAELIEDYDAAGSSYDPPDPSDPSIYAVKEAGNPVQSFESISYGAPPPLQPQGQPIYPTAAPFPPQIGGGGGGWGWGGNHHQIIPFFIPLPHQQLQPQIFPGNFFGSGWGWPRPPFTPLPFFRR
jgi:hypothetical protein